MEAVLLDALGTLLQLEAPWPNLRAALRDEWGIEVSEAQAERAFRAEMAYYRANHHEGRDRTTLAELRGRCAEVLRLALPAEAIGMLSTAELEPLMLEALRFAPYPEVPSVLGELRRRGLRLVVVSNWDISLHEALRATGLAELLDAAITSAEAGALKPAPAIFEAALKLAASSPALTLHVGDSLACDVAGALGVGIAAALLRREEPGAHELSVGHVESGGPAEEGPPGGLPAGVPVLASLRELLALQAQHRF